VLTFCLLFSENLVELFLDDYKSSFHLPFTFGMSDIWDPEFLLDQTILINDNTSIAVWILFRFWNL
jgi:hypothetical protein